MQLETPTAITDYRKSRWGYFIIHLSNGRGISRNRILRPSKSIKFYCSMSWFMFRLSDLGIFETI